MNKITTLIVDNDSASAKKLRADLAAFPEIEIQEVIPTAERAKIAIIGAQPDLLFLEIDLSDLSGMELLKELQPHIHSDMHIIFYTNHDTYLLEALRASAFDYLVKSYKKTELAQIIQRLHAAASKDPIYVERCLRKALSPGPKFGIQTISNLMLLRYEDILLFRYEGMPRFWYMLLTNRKYYKLRMNTSAKDLLGIHPFFVQISQDCIVNLHHIQAIENQSLKCCFHEPFEDVEQVLISLRYYRRLKEGLEII